MANLIEPMFLKKRRNHSNPPPPKPPSTFANDRPRMESISETAEKGSSKGKGATMASQKERTMPRATGSRRSEKRFYGDSKRRNEKCVRKQHRPGKELGMLKQQEDGGEMLQK